MKNVEVKFYQSENRPAARYFSDTTVYEECLQDGRLIGLYWSSGSNVQRTEWFSNSKPGKFVSGQAGPAYKKPNPMRLPLNTFELEIDGQGFHNQWEWVSASTRAGAVAGTEEAVVTLRHKVRPVELNVVTRLDGTPVIARYLEITNSGETPAALSHVAPISGLLWHNEYRLDLPNQKSIKHHYTLGYYKTERWGDEGDFTWQPITNEIFRVERNNGCPYGAPFYIVRNEVTGEQFYIALAWSGNFYAEFEFHKLDKILTFSMGPAGNKPLRMIAPGETVTSPEVHIAPLYNSAVDAIARWHAHLRTSVIPRRPSDKKMYIVSGATVEKPGDWLLRRIDKAVETGAEVFMVDAGWYGAVHDEHWHHYRGDWYGGPFLPGGNLRYVSDYVHEKGMLFGLWVESETMGDLSQLLKDHPDWVLNSDGKTASMFGGEGELLDLSNPEAAKYVEESLINCIKEYNVDVIKLDYNMRLPEGGQNLRDGFAEGCEWRHFEVIYKTFDRVLKEHPNVALENCAGGGGRNDLGMMSRFHYCCESDWSLLPYGIRAINGLTLFLPPEAVAQYHEHTPDTHQTSDLDTHFRGTLFALPIGVKHAEQNTVYYEKTNKYIGLLKGFCRTVMADSPVAYHHTPYIGVTGPADWCVLEYGKPDRTRGYAGVFKLDGNGDDKPYILRLRGADPDKSYRVTLDNQNLSYTESGRKLMNEGIAVFLENTGTSELVLYDLAE